MILLMIFQQAIFALVVLTTVLFFSMGAMQVEVRSKTPGGEHLHLIAPAVLLPAGAMLVPREKIRRASRELRLWLPTLHASAEEFMHYPDATFVQVDNRREHVKIAKAGGALVIDVDGAREVVHLSLPVRAVASACNYLAEETLAEP